MVHKPIVCVTTDYSSLQRAPDLTGCTRRLRKQPHPSDKVAGSRVLVRGEAGRDRLGGGEQVRGGGQRRPPLPEGGLPPVGRRASVASNDDQVPAGRKGEDARETVSIVSLD